jgi:hypothetical protein
MIRPSSRRQLDQFAQQWREASDEERVEFANDFAVLLHRFVER